jgi:hypothetical protein
MLICNAVKVQPVPITGRNLAHSVKSASQRAAIAAQLVLGELTLIDPTIIQAAEAAGISVPYVRLALVATAAEREALLSGDLTIPQIKPSSFRTLTTEWKAASVGERIKFVQAIGAETIFDTALVPALNT